MLSILSYIGSTDGTIRLWCTSNLTERHRIEHIHTMSAHTGSVVCTDLNSQYHILLSGSVDCTAALWDIRSGKVRYNLSSKVLVLL